MAVLLVVLPRPVSAEPRFSLRSGLRCARCHTSPLGGGKRTPHGALWALTHLPVAWRRPAAAAGSGTGILTTVATGEVTSWMAVGADLRLSNVTALGDETENSFRASGGSLYLELRPWRDRIVLYVDEEISGAGARNREGWMMVRGPFRTWLRGGNLLPPFGLRVLDDGALTRRAAGVGFANPDLGVELGVELGPLLAAVAVTNGSFSGEDDDALKALWGLLELGLGRFRLGLSGAYNPSEQGCRAMGGVHAGVALGRLGLQGEVDLVGLRPAASERWGLRLASLAEAELLIVRGVTLRVAHEYGDDDLSLAQDRRQRLWVALDVFPLPMLEVKLRYVLQQTESQVPADRADIVEVVLHGFL